MRYVYKFRCRILRNLGNRPYENMPTSSFTSLTLVTQLRSTACSSPHSATRLWLCICPCHYYGTRRCSPGSHWRSRTVTRGGQLQQPVQHPKGEFCQDVHSLCNCCPRVITSRGAKPSCLLLNLSFCWPFFAPRMHCAYEYLYQLVYGGGVEMFL